VDPLPNIIINPVPEFAKDYDTYNINPNQSADFNLRGVEIVGRRFSEPKAVDQRDLYPVNHRNRLEGLGRGVNPGAQSAVEQIPNIPVMLGAPLEIKYGEAPGDFPRDNKGKRLPDF
jgi:hypothetical protein